MQNDRSVVDTSYLHKTKYMPHYYDTANVNVTMT